MKNEKSFISPLSTGGVGIHFEANVGAYFAIHLLAKKIIVARLRPVQIKFQTRNLGYTVDDICAIGDDGRRLFLQIKHNLSFTNSDSEFGKALEQCWKLFNDQEVFKLGRPPKYPDRNTDYKV